MQVRSVAQVIACLLLGIAGSIPAIAQNTISFSPADAPSVPSRVVGRVDDTQLVRLTGNTHPKALPSNDKGAADPAKVLDHIILVLQRSPEQEQALASFNERQYDPKSPDFHHWLSAEEFGKLYGPSDSDVAAVSSWLENRGFQIDVVGKGRVWIQFTGTVAQVQDAFHLEMHNYLVNGAMHLSNDRDPSIPAALGPVVAGIASLNDFRPKHQGFLGNYVKRDLKTGKYTLVTPVSSTGGRLKPGTALPESGLPKEAGSLSGKNSNNGVQPEFGYVDPSTGYQREELTPYDVATIYNILPLWNASTPINGKGVKVAIIATSDIEQSDINTYRSSFGLPAMTLTVLHGGADPGVSENLGQGENTEDVEMAGATAPGAQIVLVSTADSATSSGVVLGALYIADNDVAPIATGSYGTCELDLGTGGNTLLNQTWQQATTSGVSLFESAGDQGSAGCTSQDGTPPFADTVGLQVNGFVSSPYITAVGGTDLQWPFVSPPISTYWNATNDSHGASAKGYMPEMSWNSTCSNPLLLNVYTSYSDVEALCNAAISPDSGLVEISSGSGGVSHCTTNDGPKTSSFDPNPSSCSGGYTKPTWQAGVSGIPSDGKRDVPDVSMFASYGFQNSTGIPGSALLICQASASPDNSCDYSDPTQIIYQENGGTSAASPMTAGIMALVLQKIGGAKQGLANPVFYKLASKENYSSCNSNTVAAGNLCVFYDTTTGSNAQVCITGDPNCTTSTSGDQVGILSGYSAAAGYDLTTGLGSFNVANLVNNWASASGAPAVTLSPTSATFPSTTVDTTSSTTVPVTIKNTGTASLTISKIEVTGTDASSYSVASTGSTACAATLAAGSSCVATISFKPAATGTLTATLDVLDNAGTGTQSLNITGTGAAAQTFTVSLSPTTLTFASTTEGSTSAAQIVTVKNTGTGAVTLSSETVTGTNATSFLKSATTCGSSLAAGASCTVSVEFKPAASGTLKASLSVADNATGTPQTVALTGTGAAAPTYTVSLSPTTLTFASTTEGSTTAAQIVTVKNTGTGAVTLSSETITGTNATSFLKSATTCGSTLATGASCTVSVEFKPAATGTLKANLSVADNATGTPQTVALTGTGVAATTPTITLTPASIAFPNTAVGTTSDAQVVTLKNTGSITVTVSSIALSGTDPSSFLEIGNCGTSLSAGASCAIYIAFKPASAVALTGTLSATDNASGSPQKVTLTGTGTAVPSVKLSTTSIAFPTTTHGTTSAAQAVTLTNSGTSTVDLTSITLTGTNPTDFEELNTCGPSLAAAANCVVYVAFKPASAAAFKATLSIADSGSGSPQSVTLSGTGD